MLKYDYKTDDTIRAAQDYRVIRPLGAGGMAGVYLAQHRELYRTFAVKVLHGDLWHRSDLIAMFGYEARTVARLGEPEPHPGIIEVVDLGRTKDRGRMPYMVMPYLIGETLHESLVREGSLPILQAIGLATRLCQALDHAHERGVVHRDVKPQNIFVPQISEGVALKVLDWGISKLLEQADDANVFLGTPAFASREQMLSEGIGPLSDIYSAGVVLFRCLTGTMPFAEYGAGFEQLLVAVSVPAPPLSKFGDFPRELEELVASALAKDPSRRPPSALAFAEELQKIGRAIRAARDPHTHATDRVKRGTRAAQNVRPDPITEAHIAERTVEDPEVQNWVEAQRKRWHAEGVVASSGEGVRGHAIASGEAESPVDGVTGFETTEQPKPRRQRTVPMRGRPDLREAATNVPAPISAPVGPASIQYLTKERRPGAAAAKLVHHTAPMPAPAHRTVPMARPEGQTPAPVTVSDETAVPRSLASRAKARWRWLFGFTAWKDTGRPMILAAVSAMAIVLAVVRLSGLRSSPTVPAIELPHATGAAGGAQSNAPTASREPSLPIGASPVASVVAAPSSADSAASPAATPFATKVPTPAASGSVATSAAIGIAPRPTSSSARRPAAPSSTVPPPRPAAAKPAQAPAPSEVGFDDIIRTL